MKNVRIINVKRTSSPTSGSSKFVASCDGKRVSVSHDYALSYDNNCLAAAKALIAKNRWKGRITGESEGPGGKGRSYVLAAS